MMPQKHSSALSQLAAGARRMAIIEEEFLRREVARHEAIRKENPDLWQTIESARRAQNRETAALNRRLRAEGLKPIEPQLSLAQRVKKLRRLEVRNNEESAKGAKRS